MSEQRPEPRDLRWHPGAGFWLGLVALLSTSLATCSALEQRHQDEEDLRARPAGGR